MRRGCEMFMKEIQLPEPIIERARLPIIYEGNRVEFAYPPIKGNHSDCFRAIKADTELRVAKGVELALLVHGAYTFKGGSDLWKSVREDLGNYSLRVPVRTFWFPKGILKDECLSGVLVEEDAEGLGWDSKMRLPDLTKWRQDEHVVYVSPNRGQRFIPKGKYKLGEHNAESFARDGLAITILSPKGAEIFARTAVDANLIPNIKGYDVDSLSVNEGPHQRVFSLRKEGENFNVNGGSFGGNMNGNDRAFAIFKSPTQATN